MMRRGKIHVHLLMLLAGAGAAHAQTSGFITTRPQCVPPNGQPHAMNYIQGPDPIRLSNGDVAIMVNAGNCCTGYWEGFFSLTYPAASSVATPRFSGIWATNNFSTESRGEDEAGFPSALFYGGKWRIAYTSTFLPHNMKNRDRVGRLDLDNLTYRAQTSQVSNQWIKPTNPNCRTLGSCEGRGSGILGTFVLHPNNELYVYHPDQAYVLGGQPPPCTSGWLRHKINPDMSVANLAGNGCISLRDGLNQEVQTPTWVSDIGRGADGKLYMLTDRVNGISFIDEWVSTGDAATIGLVWTKTGRSWSAPNHPSPPTVYSVWDAGYLKDQNRQIIEPKVVVAQISEGKTFDEITDVTLGKYYLYYWADAGASLPPNFGGYASSCAFGGHHDVANCTSISGWAWDTDPVFANTPISVDIFDGATKIATVPANLYRSDLQAAGKGNGVHGFSWPVPASLKNNVAHSISVKYAGTKTLLPNSPKSITCAPPTYALTVTKAGTGGGTVTSNPVGISCGTDCMESYTSGAVVALTATPFAGSLFAGWSGHSDCLDGTVSMTAARSCTATFNASGGYTLTVSKAGTGSGTVTSSPAGINCGADCSEVYGAGTVVSLTAGAASGSTFAGWSGDADCSDGMVTMSVARSCSATFNSSATARLIWIQPQRTAGFGPPGSLIVAGSASGAPAGTGVVMTWRNVSTAGPWITEPFAPGPDANGIWLNSIANANSFQLYEVYVTYGGFQSAKCTYQGGDTATWCP